ncbi:hypothetical protein GCM10027047_04140 [Rhodococcus aerolatus]
MTWRWTERATEPVPGPVPLRLCALLWAATSATGLLSVSRPSPGMHRGPLLALCLLGLAGSVAFVGVGRRRPTWFLHTFVVVGYLALAGAVVAVGPDDARAVATTGFFAVSALPPLLLFEAPVAAGYVGASLVLLHLSLTVGHPERSAASAVALCTTVTAGAVYAYFVRGRGAAEVDPLTGLLNRRGLDRRLDALVGAAAAGGPPVSVGLLDLDHFRRVNETAGAPAGDELLREVAARLARLLPAGAWAARLGGDEFAVVLPGSDGSGASTVVEAARAAVPAPATASAGVSGWEPGDTGSLLLGRADVSLYRAKRGGRGRTLTHPRADGGDALRAAVAAGELRLLLQPVVDLRSGEVVAAEALVRWAHPQLGLLDPDAFIPAAELDGSVADLDDWVLRAALAAADRFSRTHGRPLLVTVNTAGASLLRPDLPDRLRAALAETGTPPRSVCLEITETALTDGGALLDAVHRVRACGVQLAIDDFGTGWSTLSRLDELPVDFLKVDRAFVARLGADGRSPVITAIVALADAFDLQVLAEGVETPEQARALLALGCRHAQGYLMSHPVPPDELPVRVAPPADG